jgi:hypothetical protein
MRPYQHTSSAIEVDRGRASWEPDDGDVNSPPGSLRRSPARIVPLKPSPLLEQLAPRERELLAPVALGLSNTVQAVALAPDRRELEQAAVAKRRGCCISRPRRSLRSRTYN